MSRDRRRRTAEETVEILRRGGYVAPSGERVDLRAAMDKAMASVRCFDAAPPAARGEAVRQSAPPVLDVTATTTLAGAKDLLDTGAADVCCLNFASARRAGGGYLAGAQAQEESLARASGLVPLLETAAAFYRAHQEAGSALYADSVVFIDHAPVFRDDHENLLAEPWSCAIVSAAAPNLGALKERSPALLARAPAVYRVRVERILAVCRAMGRRHLVLGAWGCGVFGADPRFAAEAFRSTIERVAFAGAFDRIRFAVYDPGNTGAYHAFAAAFARPAEH